MIKEPGNLEQRVALVTGGGRGIGLAIANDLAARGASIIIADNGTGIDGQGEDPAIAEQAAVGIGKQATAFTKSIASAEGAAAAVRLAVEQFGGLDIVVNNAAILRDSFVFKGKSADWDAVLRVNLAAAYYVLNSATPIMREHAKENRGGDKYTWGRIINITSTAGLYGNFGQAPYASAKAGLCGLTRVTAMDMARSGVICNALAPFAATRVTDIIRPANDAQAQYKERALKIEPRHVATVVAWLCSPAAQEITGQIFGVRGREVFLFSQPRPVASIANEKADWDVASLATAAAERFGDQYISLETDLERFSTEPLV